MSDLVLTDHSNLALKEVVQEIKEAEYEYINISTKTDYKEATPLKQSDLKDKKLENIIEKVRKPDPKPVKEKDEDEKVATQKKEKTKVVKSDPKPVKQKDEDEIIAIQKKEEIKVAKPDPKPIKEKD